MKHDKDPRASIYTELVVIDVAHDVLSGPKAREVIARFNHQPIHPSTVADVRAHCQSVRGSIEAEGRCPGMDENDAIELCRAIEKWLCDRMGMYGEARL